MLAVTDTAAQAIHALTSQAQLPEGSGMRVAAPDPDQPSSLGLEVVAEAVEGDQVVPTEYEAKVFIEPQVVPLLDDKLLDAQVDDQGQLSFQLSMQQD